MDTTNSIEFLLGFEPRQLAVESATMTVLEYLRQVERMTGTKEGCAEGDCGACTVVLGENSNGKLSYKAANSCILFLPFLQGKQLITVEHLKQLDGNLHPVQQALVNEHGSQCGFCTPGFVMSLFAMVHNHCEPSKAAIDHALAGNLCRCTGYIPIVRAASAVLESFEKDQFDQAENQTHRQLNQMHSKSVTGQHAGQKFFAPRTVKELVAILDENFNATLVAGATDVGLWVTKQRRQLKALVYIGNIKSLKEIKQENGMIRIGAAATINEAQEVLGTFDPTLDEMFCRYGSVQIRNLATLAGNVANGSPIGDSLPALIVLGATLKLTHAGGTRTLPIEKFFLEYGIQDIRPNEFLERIDVPVMKSSQKFRIYKMSKRYHQDISSVCGAFLINFKADRIESIRICYGGMAGTPLRAAFCEKVFIGETISQDVLNKAASALEQDFNPISDFRGSAKYRMEVAKNILYRLAADLAASDEVNVWRTKYA